MNRIGSLSWFAIIVWTRFSIVSSTVSPVSSSTLAKEWTISQRSDRDQTGCEFPSIANLTPLGGVASNVAELLST